MAKQTVVVEFEDKEIRELLLAKAKELLGKPTFQGGNEISITGLRKSNGASESGPLDTVSCRITFNGKVDK